ncbi:hypothetical protein [Bacteriovorax sp. Seq25_V]|uniref:hypothetical protein n=1 Tax=Bacteriovorax sp. Seq25_V TaxID=1201288 RepID=UPI00038A05AF|nr:hypothetical protein [Bacteriovorax sp. Seq25_V]EQC46151.1 hypothetical protein M900_1728 [Bacteriovorax sp. Seq25_V]
MSQKDQAIKDDKISFIVYEENTIPYFKQVTPKVYKFFVYAPTILTFFAIAVVIASFFYTKNVEHFIRSKEPEIIKSLRTENSLLAEKGQELTILNKQLTKKLAQGVSDTPLAGQFLISPVAGQQDLTSPAKVNIQDIKVEVNNDKVFFRFNIVNVTQDGSKLSGYIHIFTTDGNTYQKYPTAQEELDNFSLKYNEGESFATSRFRPVEAIFKKMDRSTLIFKIVIFNRIGDLIHQQQYKEVAN